MVMLKHQSRQSGIAIIAHPPVGPDECRWVKRLYPLANPANCIATLPITALRLRVEVNHVQRPWAPRLPDGIKRLRAQFLDNDNQVGSLALFKRCVARNGRIAGVAELFASDRPASRRSRASE